MSGKEHHTTPQLILRGFADDRRFIVKFDLKTARQYDPQPVRGVAKQRHHYTVTDAGGERLSVIDDQITELEGSVAPIVNRLRHGDPEVNVSESAVLARFVALQLFRVPAAHQLWAETDAILDSLRPFVDGVPAAYPGRNGANARMMLTAEAAWPEIADRYAIQVVRFSPHSLLTSDVPVVMAPSPWWGPSPIDVTNAGTILLSLDHATALMYKNREHMPGVRHLVNVEGSTDAAMAINQWLVQQSQRQVLWHPESTSAGLLGDGFEFPPFREEQAPARLRSQVSKISSWARWATENPAEAAARTIPTPASPPPGARPLSIETRRRMFGND